MDEHRLLVDAFSELLADHFDIQSVHSAETEGLPERGWNAVAGGGFPWISIDEASGGSGGSLDEAFALVPLLGRYAVPLPVVESGLLAGWLCAGAGLPVDQAVHQTVSEAGGGLAVEDLPGGGVRVAGLLPAVPWASTADTVVAVTEPGRLVLALPRDEVEIVPRYSLAGEPRDDVLVDGLVLGPDSCGQSPLTDPNGQLRRRGALVRALQMAGALERASEITIEYAKTREQFGRPIARFQAVAHELAQMAEEVALATAATAVAARMYAADEPGADSAVAMCKIVAGRSSRTVGKIAHQVHGAIGTTREYQLHLFTRRLWTWTDEFGSETWWAEEFGRRMATEGPTRHWETVTSGPRSG